MPTTKENTAIFCSNVSKKFYILDDNLNWRIVFKDPSKKLEAFDALTDINLTVPKGQFVGILGRNGAGKSTLLRTLGGVYTPCSGLVKTFGDVSSLFEMGGLGNINLTGHSYASRYLQIYGSKKQERSVLLDKICEFSELGQDFVKPLYTYSSGMLARLFFATATELQHEIYLVDELLSVGDEHFQAKCWKRLRQRFTQGASGVLVTHDWSAVLKLCPTSYVLDKGRVVAQGPSPDMVRQYLNLPKPTKEYAEIHVTEETIQFTSGKDTDFDLAIYLKKELSLAINYSIELFRAGYGWEIILLNDHYVPIQCQLGQNKVRLSIKKLPLVSGQYFLNLFLKSLDDRVDSMQLDSRSWTYGNGIPLLVQGEQTTASTLLPWTIQLKGVSHASA